MTLLQISLVTTSSNNYDHAYKNMNETGRPLVVLVGADWCPGCRTMKQSVIPQLEKTGKLQQVAFATVNTDQQGPLAESLMSGGSIPQLIMYVKTEKGFERKQMIGAHSAGEVEAFINQGVSQTVVHQAAKPVIAAPKSAAQTPAAQNPAAKPAASHRAEQTAAEATVAKLVTIGQR